MEDFYNFLVGSGNVVQPERTKMVSQEGNHTTSAMYFEEKSVHPQKHPYPYT